MSLVPTPSNPTPERLEPVEPLDPSPIETAPVLSRDRRARIRAARLLAMAVDMVQLVAVPFFMPGAASPVNDLLDVVTALALTRLVGWHIGFLPTFLIELVPMVDLFPTWTLAAFVATRGETEERAHPSRGRRR